VFFIPLERSWNLDVQNALAFLIWTSAAQVMGKRRAGSQTGSLTPDHYKSGIDHFPMSNSGVRYVVEKISTRATTLVQNSSRSEVKARSYDLSKSRESNRNTFGTISRLQLGSPRKMWHSGVVPAASHRAYYREYGGGILSSPSRDVSSESEVTRGLSQH
jgi:hypothetical protein